MLEFDFIEDEEEIAEVQKAKKSLVDTTERLGMVLDHLPIGFIIHQEQSMLFANKAAHNFLNLDPEVVVGQHFMDFIPEDQFKSVFESFTKAFKQDDAVSHPEIVIPYHKGGLKYFQSIFSLLPWEGIPCVQIFMQDITEQKVREKQLEHLSSVDPLTGAQNRRSFIKYSKNLLSNEDVQDCGVIVFDIDHFKKVNDKYGHEGGDVALKVVVTSSELALARYNFSRDVQVPPAMLSRVGGEEFAVIVPNSSQQELNQLCENLRQAIETTAIKTFKHTFNVTASFGFSSIENIKGENGLIDKALQFADAALYQAKSTGRNKTVAAADIPQSVISDAHIARKTVRN